LVQQLDQKSTQIFSLLSVAFLASFSRFSVDRICETETTVKDAPSQTLPPNTGPDQDFRCPEPEDEQASRLFLKLLDPSADIFTFQTADDDRSRRNPLLASVIHSPPPVRDQLQRLNDQGAGIFVTANETDGKGRKSENIKRIRAVWQEDDAGFDGPFPLEPSMVVETSPGRFHRYWLVAGDFAGRRTWPRRIRCSNGPNG
jgi:hypothetical protein